MVQLYKEEKYNPFLTILIQFLPLPIFLGVFFALNFLLKTPNLDLSFLKIIDLSQRNIFLILVIILFQFLSLNQLPKEQRNFSLIFFGLIILILFQFPALFSLYWLINIILTLLERHFFPKFTQVLSNKT